MFIPLFKSNLLLLPVPASISYFWGIGSTLGVGFVFQVVGGILLSLSYVRIYPVGRVGLESYFIKLGWWHPIAALLAHYSLSVGVS